MCKDMLYCIKYANGHLLYYNIRQGLVNKLSKS